MSEPENNERTSVIDLEASLHTTDVEIPKFENKPALEARPKPHPLAQVKVHRKTKQEDQDKANKKEESQNGAHKKHLQERPGKISELKTQHKEKLQSIMKKHHAEQMFFKNALKEQAKKSKDNLRLALKEAEGNYRSQLQLLRKEYQNHIDTIQNELKNFLANEMAGMKKQSENLLMTDSQNRIEQLQQWLHGEFVNELQNKTNEVEQIKAQAVLQAQNLVQEIDQRNKEIVYLQSKIKEIAPQLKRGLREEILTELGLEEDEDEGKDKKKKARQAGLFAKLGSIF